MTLHASALALTLLITSVANAQEPAPAASAAPAPAKTATTTAPAPAKPESIESEAPRVYLEETTIVVDGKAEYNGSIAFEFTPLGGTSKTFTVTVLAKAGRKDIAKDIHKELTIAAGGTYKVKLSGAEVRVSRNKGAPNFAIVVKKLNATGVSVLVKRR